ncbi:MAG: hypothetical protein U0797_22155 [Gemmataceae bacterium]
MKIWKVVLGAGLFPCLAVGCVKESAGQRRPKFVERLPRVEVVQPAPKRLVRRLETSATVEALKKVEISARVPGVVIDLDDHMDIGRAVKKGEVLLRLDVPDLVAERESKRAMEETAKRQEALAGVALKVAARVEPRRREAVRGGRGVQQAATGAGQGVGTAAGPGRAAGAGGAAGGGRRLLANGNRVSTTKRRAKVEQAQADLDLARQQVRGGGGGGDQARPDDRLRPLAAPFDGVVTRRLGRSRRSSRTPAVLLTVMQASTGCGC